MTLRVAAAQLQPLMNAVEENLQKMEDHLRRVMKAHPDARLVAMPELATTGYECGRRFFDLAEESRTAPCATRMGTLCREYGVHLVYGFAERDAVLRDVLYSLAASASASATTPCSRSRRGSSHSTAPICW